MLWEREENLLGRLQTGLQPRKNFQAAELVNQSDRGRATRRTRSCDVALPRRKEIPERKLLDLASVLRNYQKRQNTFQARFQRK